MAGKFVPFTKDQLESIISTHPTPFHIYDEKAIRENAGKLKETSPGLRASGSTSRSRQHRIPTS